MPQRLPEFLELDAYRLDQDWTWEQLAAEMKRKGVPVAPTTLHYVLKRGPENAKPRDRTVHKIREFLRLTKEARQRANRRKAAGGKSVAASA